MRMTSFHAIACAAFAIGIGLAGSDVKAVPAPDAVPQIANPIIADHFRASGTTRDTRTPDALAQDPNIQVAHRYNRRYGRRYRGPRGGYRYRYRGWYYSSPWWRPAPPRARYGGRGHVNWCLNRYRSYNPRTDLFLGYDGYYHRCRLPYRY